MTSGSINPDVGAKFLAQTGKTRVERRNRSAEGQGEATNSFAFVFAVFYPKIACQALQPSNPLPDSNMRVSHGLHPNGYTRNVE
jgi:hypothetical protein